MKNSNVSNRLREKEKMSNPLHFPDLYMAEPIKIIRDGAEDLILGINK